MPASRSQDVAKICAKCGYDLRGHADDASCPECGLSIAKSDYQAKRRGYAFRPLMHQFALMLVVANAIICYVTGPYSQSGSQLLISWIGFPLCRKINALSFLGLIVGAIFLATRLVRLAMRSDGVEIPGRILMAYALVLIVDVALLFAPAVLH
jgi:hypothetical protein